eukprot:jgi/Chrzof1/4518/Cz14g16140.t1_LCKAS10
MKRPVYLVDFSVCKPPDELQLRWNHGGQEAARSWVPEMNIDPDTPDFFERVSNSSGIDLDRTYFPPSIHPLHCKKPAADIDGAWKEAEMVVVPTCEALLEKTGVAARDIDVVITSTSLFCPIPSLACMLANKLKMKPTVKTYPIGGLGCSAGVSAMSLIRDLLQASPNINILFVPAEIITKCLYTGEQKDLWFANALFRMGGAAALLSNKACWKSTAKYQLLQDETWLGAHNDDAYSCLGWTTDAAGNEGLFLRKDLVTHMGKALEQCMRKLAPRIMTWKQYGEAAYSAIYKAAFPDMKVPEYIPDFTQCVDHFAIHAGGLQVLQGVQRGLRLPLTAMLPSYAVMHDYGNTSCSSTFYAMAYNEACCQVLKGDKLMQVGLGSGPLAAINIWHALRNISNEHTAWSHRVPHGMTEEEVLNNRKHAKPDVMKSSPVETAMSPM